jgi:hypothetical protein
MERSGQQPADPAPAQGAGGDDGETLPSLRPIVLAYETLKDPRDLAEVIHFSAGLGAEVHLLGKSLDPRHWKVLRKLRSWRPDLSGRPSGIHAKTYTDAAAWAQDVRARGFVIAGTVLEGGEAPWSGSLESAPAGAGASGIAVLFGEETHGLGQQARSLCDVLWTLPLGTGGRFYTIGQTTAMILGALKALERGGESSLT